MLQTKESCSVAPPDGHTAVQTDGRRGGGVGGGGGVDVETRMLTLFKALCVYLKCIRRILSRCCYEDEFIAATCFNVSPSLSLAIVGKCSK